MKAVVEAAGLDLGHMVFVNPYLTATLPDAGHESTLCEPVRVRQHSGPGHDRGLEPAQRRANRVHRRCGSRLEGTARRAPQEYAAQPHGKSLRFCRRYVVLFREERLYPRTERRSLSLPRPPSSFVRRCATFWIISKKPIWNFCQVVSTNVYLDNMADMRAFDEVYAKYFRD